MSFTLLLLLAAQVGPFTGSGGASPSPLPPELRDRPARTTTAVRVPQTIPPPPVPSRLQACLDTAGQDPAAAIDLSRSWLAQAKGAPTAEPQLCLGSAQSALGHWDEAQSAFVAGRDAAVDTDKPLRARLGAMAGNAALARGDAAGALALLDPAKRDAEAAGDAALAAETQVDRARALVLIHREADAATALAEARRLAPGNAEAWLLSATLSRRMSKLAEAQTQIEQAVSLAPQDAEIGLEAGLIAMLSGHEEAARKSWKSVTATAPDSEAAKTAKRYLDLLGPEPGPALTPTR